MADDVHPCATGPGCVPDGPALQANTWVEDGQDRRKYAVGARLVFTGYDRAEVEVVPHTGLEYGDELVVRPANGCGMGIDVDRVRDGLVDMVWPTEVEVAG